MNRVFWLARCCAGCAALALLPIATPAVRAAEYEFHIIEAFQPDYDLREVLVRDINVQGLVCGTSTDLPSYSGYWWGLASDKTRVPITLVTGIDNLGRVTGLNRVFDPATGTTQIIPVPPGGVTGPITYDLNDHGIAVGYSELCTCSNSGALLQIAFWWSPTSGSHPTTVANARELTRVSNTNLAVGNTRTGPGVGDAFFYDIASGRSVLIAASTTPAGTSPLFTQAYDINDAGQIAGEQRSPSVVYRGFVWSEANGLALLPATSAGLLSLRPRGINNDGAVVGWGMTTASGAEHAFVWSPAQGVRDLNLLATLPANFILDRAVEISDAGWIVGQGHYGPDWGTTRGFVLRPTALGPLDVPPASRSPRFTVAPVPSRADVSLNLVLPFAQRVRIVIYDVNGREITVLHEGFVSAGAHAFTWEARTAAGRAVPPGVYLVKLDSPATSITRHVVISR